MTVKKKIIISSILLVCIPVALACILWGTYIGRHSEMYMDPLQPGSVEDNYSYNMQYMLYLYENELNRLDFTEGFSARDNDPDIIPREQTERLSELAETGFHLRISSGGDILFSNLDAEDTDFLEDHPEENYDVSESLEYDEGHMLVRSQVTQNNVVYHITAVFDPSRVNAGMLKSFLPIYFVSPQIMAVFTAIILVSILITALLVTQWISRSIIKPLDLLVSASEQIGEGNLDTPVSYEKTDEFGTVIRKFDYMRRQLKTAQEEKEKADEITRDFLTGVSHDLRSPMTSIRGYTEGLRDGIADTEEKRNRYYDAILTRTSDMERLLGKLSDLVRVENGSLRLQKDKVNIDEFLRQFMEEEQFYAEQNGISFRYQNQEPELEAAIDIREMRRVFLNLLENTVKYREKDSSLVRINVSVSDDSRYAGIHFRDDGHGVREDQLPRIFESFYRADASRTRPETGSGLGLAVVKGIVEAHGGTVEAKNNGGLEIIIRIPLWKTERREIVT